MTDLLGFSVNRDFIEKKAVPAKISSFRQIAPRFRKKSPALANNLFISLMFNHGLPFYFHGVTPSDVAVMSPFSLLLWRPLSLSDVAFLRARAKITRVMFAFVFPF